MPWRGPETPGEFPTLGYLVADWIEAHCVVPDGDQAGEPFVLSDEQLQFFLWLYRLKPDAAPPRDGERFYPSEAFAYDRGGQLVAPQKWGKGPLAAGWVCAESAGPVIFDGWDADGEPVGRPWSTPWLQVTAVSEDQTDNVWKALVPMIEQGDLAADIPDTGETRINLPGGGTIQPVTSSARSRLGQRITGAVQDEEHDWTDRNGGRKLADNQRRNLSGMGGRFLATGNAWDPAEQSVAQYTHEKEPGVYKLMLDAGAGSVHNKRDRERMLKRVYKGAPWVSIDRIDSEIVAMLPRDPSQAERFYLNRIVAGEGVAFDVERWRAPVEDGGLADPRKVVADKAVITVGVDGARFDDALAMVATDVASGHQWPLDIIEQPEHADDDYEHDLDRADGALAGAFDRWKVWRVYVDPQRIEALLERWQGRYGDKVVMPWWTNRPKPFAYACRRYRDGIGSGDLSNDGDSTMARHIGNATKRHVNVLDEEQRRMWVVSKPRPMSPLKIDAAAAGVLSWEGRGDAIAAGVMQRTGRAAFV